MYCVANFDCWVGSFTVVFVLRVWVAWLGCWRFAGLFVTCNACGLWVSCSGVYWLVCG